MRQTFSDAHKDSMKPDMALRGVKLTNAIGSTAGGGADILAVPVAMRLMAAMPHESI